MKRNPSFHDVRLLMGFISLNPSYKRRLASSSLAEAAAGVVCVAAPVGRVDAEPHQPMER